MAKQSLEQFVAGLGLEIINVPIDQIDFTEGNPNELPPDLYEALKTEIRDYGFWQPVLVCPNGERFDMIDGEHRTRIVSELGGQTIPAVVTGEMDADERRLMLITMNRFKGRFNPLPLAEMLSSIDRSEAQIRQRIAMDETALRDSLALANFTDIGEALREDLERERAEAPVVIRFVVNDRDGEIIERVVSAAAGDKLNRGQALAKVCAEWERSQKTKAKETQ